MPGTRSAQTVIPVGARSAEAAISAITSIQPRYRRVGMRLSCLPCEVAWTGTSETNCWVCEGLGIPGPPPSIYPDAE